MTLTSHQVHPRWITQTQTLRHWFISAIWQLFIYEIFNPTHFPLWGDSLTSSLFLLKFSHSHKKMAGPESLLVFMVLPIIWPVCCKNGLELQSWWFATFSWLTQRAFILCGTGVKGRFYSWSKCEHSHCISVTFASPNKNPLACPEMSNISVLSRYKQYKAGQTAAASRNLERKKEQKLLNGFFQSKMSRSWLWKSCCISYNRALPLPVRLLMSVSNATWTLWSLFSLPLYPRPPPSVSLFQSFPASLQLLIHAEGEALILLLEKNEWVLLWFIFFRSASF